MNCLFNAAGRDGLLRFYGRKTYKIGDIEPQAASGITELIEATYFDQERDFDVQFGQIFFASPFHDGQHLLDAELLASREGAARDLGVFEWSDVTVEREGLLARLASLRAAEPEASTPVSTGKRPTAPPVANVGPSAPPPKIKHRPSNGLDFQARDAVFFPEMTAWLQAGKSPEAAAREILIKHRAAVAGSNSSPSGDDGKVKRLAKHYRDANSNWEDWKTK